MVLNNCWKSNQPYWGRGQAISVERRFAVEDTRIQNKSSPPRSSVNETVNESTINSCRALWSASFSPVCGQACTSTLFPWSWTVCPLLLSSRLQGFDWAMFSHTYQSTLGNNWQSFIQRPNLSWEKLRKPWVLQYPTQKIIFEVLQHHNCQRFLNLHKYFPFVSLRWNCEVKLDLEHCVLSGRVQLMSTVSSFICTIREINMISTQIELKWVCLGDQASYTTIKSCFPAGELKQMAMQFSHPRHDHHALCVYTSSVFLFRPWSTHAFPTLTQDKDNCV